MKVIILILWRKYKIATEILSVPEDNLEETIKIIRSGLKLEWKSISEETKDNLIRWCDEEEEYIKFSKNGEE